MGIKGLSQLIADSAPGSVKENEIKNYFGMYFSIVRCVIERVLFCIVVKCESMFELCCCCFIVGRKIAIDASMCLYQFLIAVRVEGAQLTSVDGETTSHLMGMFYRTIRMLDNGIKPVYVPFFFFFCFKFLMNGFTNFNQSFRFSDMFLMENHRS